MLSFSGDLLTCFYKETTAVIQVMTDNETVDDDIISDETIELDRHWHLSTNEHEIALTEVEFSLFRTYESFFKWMRECTIAATGVNLGASDCVTLNIIAMRGRPKGMTEIARLLNRDDTNNIQYSIGKLIQDDLVEKTSTDNRRKGVRYRATTRGKNVLKRFVALRKGLLIESTKAIKGMDDQLANCGKTLDLLAGMYEQAALVAATHRPAFDEEE